MSIEGSGESDQRADERSAQSSPVATGVRPSQERAYSVTDVPENRTRPAPSWAAQDPEEPDWRGAPRGGGADPQEAAAQQPTEYSGAAAGEQPRSGRASRRAEASAARRTPRATPRRVKLIVSRLDPWSVMKISFLLSVAVGIAGVVLVGVLWTILQGMGVFTQVNSVVNDVLSNEANPSSFDLMDYIGFGRVISLSVVLGVVDVVLLTAICTLMAFLYNICSALVGGLQVTLSDD